jgi:hypothetical protein
LEKLFIYWWSVSALRSASRFRRRALASSLARHSFSAFSIAASSTRSPCR